MEWELLAAFERRSWRERQPGFSQVWSFDSRPSSFGRLPWSCGLLFSQFVLLMSLLCWETSLAPSLEVECSAVPTTSARLSCGWPSLVWADRRCPRFWAEPDPSAPCVALSCSDSGNSVWCSWCKWLQRLKARSKMKINQTLLETFRTATKLNQTYVFVRSIGVFIPNSLAIHRNLWGVIVDDVIVQFVEVLGAKVAVDALERSHSEADLEMTAHLIAVRPLSAFYALCQLVSIWIVFS